jgi:hypothetical protein
MLRKLVMAIAFVAVLGTKMVATVSPAEAHRVHVGIGFGVFPGIAFGYPVMPMGAIAPAIITKGAPATVTMDIRVALTATAIVTTVMAIIAMGVIATTATMGIAPTAKFPATIR